jgi:hypothetical protein
MLCQVGITRDQAAVLIGLCDTMWRTPNTGSTEEGVDTAE